MLHGVQGGGGGSSVKAGTSVAATAGSEDVDFEYDDDIAGSDEEEAKMYEELQVCVWVGGGGGHWCATQHAACGLPVAMAVPDWCLCALLTRADP